MGKKFDSFMRGANTYAKWRRRLVLGTFAIVLIGLFVAWLIDPISFKDVQNQENPSASAGSSNTSERSNPNPVENNLDNENPKSSTGSFNTNSLGKTFSLLNACLNMPENQAGLDIEFNHEKISGNEREPTDADKLNGVSLQADLSAEIPIRRKGTSDWVQATLNFVAEEKKGVVTITADNENDLAEDWECESRSGLSPIETREKNGRHKYVDQGGLLWMPATFSTAWSDAKSFCTSFNGLGKTGWRLPTYDELKSLHDSGAMNDQGWKLTHTWTSPIPDVAYNLADGRVSTPDSELAGQYKLDVNKDPIYVTCVR